MNVQTIMDIIGYVVGIILACICGYFYKEVRDNRRTIDELRDLNKGTGCSAEGALDTIAEIRKNQQVSERCSNCGNNSNCCCNTNNNILDNKESLN